MSSIQIRNQDCRQIAKSQLKLVQQLNLNQDFYVKFIKLNMEEIGPTSQQTSLDSQTLVCLRETIKREQLLNSPTSAILLGNAPRFVT